MQIRFNTHIDRIRFMVLGIEQTGAHLLKHIGTPTEQTNYRALLCNITGKRSSKALSAAELLRVRNHMQALGEHMGVLVAQRQRPLPAETFAKAKAAASPRERKVWALWHQLHRDGVVRDASARSLRGFVERQTGGVSDLRFCNAVQLDAVIEALKDWQRRGASGVHA